jgi:hypothetical protein
MLLNSKYRLTGTAPAILFHRGLFRKKPIHLRVLYRSRAKVPASQNWARLIMIFECGKKVIITAIPKI